MFAPLSTHPQCTFTPLTTHSHCTVLPICLSSSLYTCSLLFIVFAHLFLTTDYYLCTSPYICSSSQYFCSTTSHSFCISSLLPLLIHSAHLHNQSPQLYVFSLTTHPLLTVDSFLCLRSSYFSSVYIYSITAIFLAISARKLCFSSIVKNKFFFIK